MNYYERHLGDYAKDTGHLSMLEHGAYTLLLDRYYATEAGIPADRVHRIARARTKDEKAAVDVVLQEFFVLDEGVWINRRAEEEIGRARLRISTAQANGRKGGRPPGKAGRTGKSGGTGTREEPGGFSAGSEKESGKEALQTPDTSYQIPEATLYPVETECPAARFPGFLRAGPATGEEAGVLASGISAAMRRHGIEAQPADPRIRALAVQGVAVETVEAACRTARVSKPPDERIPAGYVVKILENWAKKASGMKGMKAVAGGKSDEENRRVLDELTGRCRRMAEAGRTIDAEARFV